MDMVEKVARALCAATGTIWGGPRGEDDPNWLMVKAMFYSQARAALDAIPWGWQSIETVPTDGTRVMFAWVGCVGDYAQGPQAIGYYKGQRLQLDNADDNEKVHPQYWMPLPPPPQSE